VRLGIQTFKVIYGFPQKWNYPTPNQPVIVGRYGKAVETGNRNGYSDPMSQEAQARYLLSAVRCNQRG